MKKGIFAFLAILTVFAMVMVSCGGGDSGGTTTTDTRLQITFDHNYAGGPKSVVRIAKDTPLGNALPAAPTRATTTASDGTKTAYAFEGWNEDADGDGDEITGTSTFAADTTVYAQWREYDPDREAVVTFYMNDGTSEVVEAVIVELSGIPKKGTVGDDMPDNPEREGYKFKGWATTNNATTANFIASTEVTENISVYAIWEETKEPVLAPLDATGFYVKDTEEDTTIRVTIKNSTVVTSPSYQWYKSDTEDGDGTAIASATSRDYAPPVTVIGTTWYFVKVTNTATNESVFSTRTKVVIYEKSPDTAVERIVAQNAAMPLWQFVLPEGAKWADYEEFSIEYYVSKFSMVAKPTSTIRSRLYGSYILADFTIPDQNNTNGWGSLGGVSEGFRIINWNDTTGKVTRPGVTSINPNNDFILDGSRATNKPFTEVFQPEGGGASTWFTAKYATGGGGAKDWAFVTNQDEDDVDIIFVGAGIFGGGGNQDKWEFFTRNPTLLNKNDPNLNIVGTPKATSTNEWLFAGNVGSARNGTTRSVLDDLDDSYIDKPGEIYITVALAGGKGAFEDGYKIDGGAALPAAFFAAEDPTRKYYDFVGWFDGETAVTNTTTFTVSTTITAKWESNTDRLPHPYPTAEADTVVEIGELNGNLSSTHQPGWNSDEGGSSFTVAEFVWATKLVFTLEKAFTGGCRFNWGSEAEVWSTGSHDTAITKSDGALESLMTVDNTDPAKFIYTIDLTKLNGYADMIMAQESGQLYFQYWGGGDFADFTTIKPTDAKIIVPKPAP